MTVDSKIATAAGKAPLHLLPLRWLVGLARVFEFGRKKHGRENYYASDNDPDECERYVSAVLRHLSAMQTPGGSYTPTSCATSDGESGVPHLDHALAGLVMLRARMCKSGALEGDPGLCGPCTRDADTGPCEKPAPSGPVRGSDEPRTRWQVVRWVKQPDGTLQCIKERL